MYKKRTTGQNYCIFNIGDIHFSNNNAEHLYKELDDLFIKDIQENKDVVDMVVVTGDIFHYELKMSSQAASYAYGFIARLVDICTNNEIVLRLIKGTESHDCGQFNSLKSMYQYNPYVKVITKVEAEEVFPGFKCLYIPEEYPKDYKEYYKDLIFNVPDKEYEFTFFHGTVEFQAFSSQVYESEKCIESAPVWKCEDLIRITNGIIAGGHIHKACNYKNKIFYHGSYSRMAQGEEHDKGFNIYDYISPTDFEVYREINDEAPIFKQINLLDIVIENSGNIEEIIRSLDKLSDDKDVTYRINMDKQIKEDYPEIHGIIREYIAGKANIDIKDVVTAKVTVSTENAQTQEESTTESENPMSFLANNSMSLEEKIQKFAVDILHENIQINDIETAIANI